MCTWRICQYNGDSPSLVVMLWSTPLAMSSLHTRRCSFIEAQYNGGTPSLLGRHCLLCYGQHHCGQHPKSSNRRTKVIVIKLIFLSIYYILYTYKYVKHQ